MKIKNSSDFSTFMIRKMVYWICRQIKLPAKYLREITVTKTSYYYRGRCWGRRILLRIENNQARYPSDHTYAGRSPDNGWPVTRLNSPIDALVNIAAHELFHSYEKSQKAWRYTRADHTQTEKRTEHEAKKITELFQSQQEQLLADWMPAAADAAPPKNDVLAKRATKAQADLARWERKLKLAKSKVAKYTKRARYYQKKVTA